MTRLGAVLLAAAATGIVGSFAFGTPLLSIVFLVAGMGILLWVRAARAARVTEAPWSAPLDADGAAGGRSAPRPQPRPVRS